MKHRPHKILLSRTAADSIGDRLGTVARQHGREVDIVVAPATLRHALPATDIQVGFYSRDLWEGSSVEHPNEVSLAFVAQLARSTALNWAHVCSAGADLAIYRQLPPHCTVTTSPGAGAVPIAQSVLAAVLWQARQFPRWQRAQAARLWNPSGEADVPVDLDRQTAVVVGMGPIGLEIGRLLASLGMRVVGLRRSIAAADHFAQVDLIANIELHLPTCDWLVLACPLTEDTRGLLDARRLALLPHGARLANVGRGPLLDEQALLAALHDGRIAGAYLDVFACEPLPPDSPVWDTPNLLVSPHASSHSSGNARRVENMFLENFSLWLQGRPLRHASSDSMLGRNAAAVAA